MLSAFRPRAGLTARVKQDSLSEAKELGWGATVAPHHCDDEMLVENAGYAMAAGALVCAAAATKMPSIRRSTSSASSFWSRWALKAIDWPSE